MPLGVAPDDTLTFGGVALLLGVVSLLAAYLPARSAARIDPAVALRAEWRARKDSWRLPSLLGAKPWPRHPVETRGNPRHEPFRKTRSGEQHCGLRTDGAP